VVRYSFTVWNFHPLPFADFPALPPIYASWLNQVEIWFNLITQRAIRRGTFRSVKALVSKIEQFVAQYNLNAKPFVWTATADSILEKIRRLCQCISETQH
jgi:putative transposase